MSETEQDDSTEETLKADLVWSGWWNVFHLPVHSKDGEWQYMRCSWISALTFEIVLVRHVEGLLKAVISALRSEERWYTRGNLSAPPCWISVIDWTLQLIGLIWHITTSLEFHIGVKTHNKLKCITPKFYIFFCFLCRSEQQKVHKQLRNC